MKKGDSAVANGATTKKSRTKSFVGNILLVVFCIALAFVISNILFVSLPVDGSSMESTLYNEDRILLFKLDKEYKYGDIIVFNTHRIDPKTDKEQHLVKRIIGLPGDEIEIVKDNNDDRYYVYRNGEKLVEDYLDDDKQLSAQQARVVVPDGCFYYLGDNRPVSQDSRSGAMYSLDDIVGRVIVRYKFDLKDFVFKFIKRQ